LLVHSGTAGQLPDLPLSGIPGPPAYAQEMDSAQHSVRTRALVTAVAALMLMSGVAACGDDRRLSDRELAEIGRLTEDLRARCTRHRPLVGGNETAPALRTVERMMKLVSKAPNQRWVVYPEDHDTGTTTPAGRMQYVGEVLRVTPRRGQPACSEFLAERVEQFLIDIGYPDF